MSKAKDKRINEVIKKASELFIEKSIEEVTVVDIANSLNIGEASIYRYFGKKENLVYKVAIYLWNEVKAKYFDYQLIYKESKGLEQVKQFFNCFIDIYSNNQSFFMFINDFDNYIIDKNIAMDDINEYEKELLTIKDIFDNIWDIGVNDKSIKANINKDEIYFTYTHALLSTCAKLSKRAILHSDSLVSSIKQITLLIDVFIDYIKGGN